MVKHVSLTQQECREAFDAEETAEGMDKLILTAGVAAVKSTIDTAYDIPEITK